MKEIAMTSRFKMCAIAATLALLVYSPLDAAPKKGGPKLVPFKGRFTGVAVSTDMATTDPNTGIEVTTTEVTIEGGGNGTHLGRYTLDATSTSSSDSEDHECHGFHRRERR